MREKQVEQCIRKHLANHGWCVKPRNGAQGIDIEATKEAREAIIEVKGWGIHSTAMRNNFYAVLGQILKDMNNPNAEYYVAFPEIHPYTKLWGNLPNLAKQKTSVKAIWVDSTGNIKGI